jgi:sigma-B regulation protein RsbQ
VSSTRAVRLVLCLLPLTAAVGCSPQGSPPAATEAAAADPAAPATGVVSAADGVPIAYEVRGAGDTAVVFVHCWACNRSFWREQVGPVAAAGYRLVALDLPGHGESGAGRQEWTIAAFAADVEAVVEALDLRRVALVGHSMGGPVSVTAAARMAGRVIGVVCVDTLHDAEFEWPEGMAESIAAQLEADYRAGMESFVPQLFRKGADPQLVRWVIDQAVETSDHAATIALMRAFPAFDSRAALAAAGVPIRCINAAPAGEEGFATRIDVNRKYADFDAVLMEGVGHYIQLERPEEFNRKLLGILASLSAAS